MTEIVRTLPRAVLEQPVDSPLTREWIVTNGLGGYSSATVSGALTRRCHGLLIAALPAPLGRMVMLNHVEEHVRTPDGIVHRLGGEDPLPGEATVDCLGHIAEFRTELQMPVWRFALDDRTVIEKRITMPYRQNIVHITFSLLSGPAGLSLTLRPGILFRPIEGPVTENPPRRYVLSAEQDRYRVTAGPDLPALRLAMVGSEGVMTLDGGHRREVFYRLEAERGYDSRGALWSPGQLTAPLGVGHPVTLIASTEPWETILALMPDYVLACETDRRRRLVRMAVPALQQEAVAAELVLAADAFIVTPVGRVADMARARAEGDEVRTVVAGYHWFTDWGRDTMISLEGLTLVTGRTVEAGWILRTFAHYVRHGLIPNMFPEGRIEGLYHTADATLWFFQALSRYVAVTGDRHTLAQILPQLVDIADHHLRGTLFGIRVDPADGLLRQGEEGYQLTWMDAKVDGWVVTPRRGKAVEINALWYNALKLLAGWLRAAEHPDAASYESHAERVRVAFNRRFWYAPGGYLYDVVDGEGGDDPACRPNQLLAIALDHPVLDREHWEAVVETARDRLLTPVGLRSLAPGHTEYKAKYFGDLRVRDAAYHQGTVWAWLIGPFIDAWLKLHPEDGAGARAFLAGFPAHLNDAGIGQISEIFDAEPPFTARGCMAQAWSVAEVLRCLAKTAPEPAPPGD